jgi:hydrogenase maturation protease
MDPATVLAMLKTLGGTPGKIYIVGCEPACVDEVVGLSREATHAIDDATELILKILWCSDAAAGARDG